MNRKIVSMLLIFMLVLTAAGCAPKQTPRELLEEATTKTMDINSAEQDVNMHLSLDLGENPDPMVEMFASMLKDVTVKLHAKTILEDTPRVAMDASAELSGMTYSAELYMTEDQMIMKVPMMEQYLVQDMMTEEGESLTLTKAESVEINKKIYSLILSKVTDEELVMEEGVTATINGEEIKVTNISMSFDDARTKELFKDIFLTIMKDESFRELMITSQKNQMAMAGIELTDEEVLEELDTMVADFESGWDEAITYFTMDKFDLSYNISKDKYIVGSKFDMAVTVSEPETQTNIKVSILADSQMYNINKIDELEYPELTDENSTSIEELNSLGY